MELQQKIIDYIETQLDLYAPVSAVPMAEGKEGISLTLAPSRYETEFMDGKVNDVMLLQISAKHKESIKALKAVTDIAYTMEKAPGNAITSDEGAFCIRRIKIYTNPNLAYMDTNQTYVYVAMIQVFYLRG